MTNRRLGRGTATRCDPLTVVSEEWKAGTIALIDGLGGAPNLAWVSDGPRRSAFTDAGYINEVGAVGMRKRCAQDASSAGEW